MNTDELNEARCLRLRGLKYAAIGRRLGKAESTIYRALNPESRAKARTAQQKWDQNDIQFRLRENLRRRLHQAIRNQHKSGSTVKDLGCSISVMKQHLEDQFQPGMTWANYGQWHIDHIQPLASFNLEDRQQFLQANHYTNLQPLWAEDNWSKGG
ncbi:MAG: helix-turn-helix domain-containing protein [Nitrososphaera sp.]|nr:helix-turn-helix domain-containing protein [Nitrososphaera sp.]